MSVASRITNVAILGLLISLCLYSDRGFGHVGAAEQIVDTDPHVVLELGNRGILPCRIQRRGFSVDWKRQLSSETELLVSLDLLFNVGERDGLGYEAGLFNITDYYSLVIEDVKVQDEGLYICEFIDHQTGKVFRNSTVVFVQAYPDEPFPVIQECIGKDVNSGACILATHQTLNLTCLVRGYYPDIDLFFLHGSEKMIPTEYEEWSNVDGTKNKEIRVQISVSDEPYECVASGLQGMVEKRSVSVIVEALSPGVNVAVVVALVLMVVGISLSIAVFFLYRRRNNRGNFSSQGYSAVNTVGDIPSRFNDNIHKVAEAISDDRDLRRLGVELGLKHSMILRAITKNWEDGPKTRKGNNWMLRKWANTITRSDLMPTLRAALDRAGLTEIAETCLSSGIGDRTTRWSQRRSNILSTLPSEQDAYETTMPDAVRNLRDKLKARYREKYSGVRTSTVDSDSLRWLQYIFVSLVLILISSLFKDETTDRKISIEDVYRLIEKESEKGFTTRVALKGEVGVGKSTLFSKIALDWANGKRLSDIDLLFYEPFQDMEETQSFGNLIRNIFPDITQSEKEQIEIYIQTNQRKAAILIYVVDETKMNFLAKNPSNTVVSIVRGDKFQDTPVFIGTRPFVVDLIKTNDSIRQLYTVIHLKGFTKQGAGQYIKQFFEEDRDSATSLIQFLERNAVASELMAPYPIFCATLCNIWNTEIKREAIEQLSTISLILKQVYFSLLERYSWKQGNSESGYTYFMQKAQEAVKIVAYVAFEGLLKDQITFDCSQELIESRREAADTLYEIGILSKEKKVSSRKIRLTQGKLYHEAFWFPHLLLQEFIASFHLASLFEDNPSQFKKTLKSTLLEDWKKYRHLLFFTAFHGGKVGKSVMESLCQRVRDIDFIIEAAFECHHADALDPIKKLLRLKRLLVPDLLTSHKFSASLFALETYGKEVIEEVEHRPKKAVSQTTTEDQPKATGTYCNDRIVQYTKTLFRSPNCRSLLLADSNLENEFFFSTMAAEAKKSQIMFLKHKGGRLSPDESADYAKAIVAMPNLQNLELCDVALSSDDFYPAIAQGASKSKIMSLKHKGGSLGPKASAQYAKAIVSMPNLQNLELSDVELLSDEFYPKMADGASQSRIVTLKHEGGKVSEDASAHYAKAIFSMPNLEDLELRNVKLSDEFYLQPTLPKQASNTKLKKLKHLGGSLGSDASSNYAKCLSSMPDLKSLEVENVKLHDKFYKRASKEASKSKVEVLRHADAELGPVASSYYGQALFSMQNLRSLELERVKLSDEFYSTMSSSTSKSEITSLRHADGVLSRTSSYNYAKGLFSMPRLQSLELTRMKLTDGFFKVMSIDATNSQIERLRLTDADLSHAASYDYGTGLCIMPKLQTLELLKVNLTDKFSESVAAVASRAKIQTLIMKWCTMNCRILRAILSLPLLQSLNYVGKLDLPDDIDERRVTNLGTSNLKDLSVDGRNVAGLWKLELHKSCPRVKKLTLYFYNEDLDSSDTISTACSALQQLTELHIDWQKTLDPQEFCSTVKRSCPKLTKLTLTRIELNNDKATEIIQIMKTHPHLTILEMDSCWTDDYLDPMIAEVNNELKLTVNVRHGPH